MLISPRSQISNHGGMFGSGRTWMFVRNRTTLQFTNPLLLRSRRTLHVSSSNLLTNSQAHWLTFFCPFCPSRELNNPRALEQAKSNVRKHFLVVGVLEHLNCTLQVTERKINTFFGSVQQMYYNELLGKLNTISACTKRLVWKVLLFVFF